MKRWVFLFCVIAMTAKAADVSVKKDFIKKTIAVSGAGPAVDVLKNDLRLSGSFEIKVPAEYAVEVTGGAVTVTQTTTKQPVLAKTYPGEAARAVAHAMADDIVQTITGKRGIAQTKIAFIYSQKRGVKELAVMDYDGFNIRLLTHDGKISAHPRWSPDGQRIVYTSYWKGYPDIVEANLATNQRRVLANFPGLNTGAVYSPDGDTIALTLSKDGNPELYTMNAGGGGFRRLTNTKGAESSPTWSPDGQTLAFVSDDRGSPQIYTMSRSGGEPTRLTVSPAYNTEPDWSHPPAGSDPKSMLALTSRVGGQFQIGVFNGASGQVEPKVADADCEDPTWAPDGRHLVFAKMRNWRSRLYLLDVVTNEQVELPVLEGEASEPAWGPWH